MKIEGNIVDIENRRIFPGVVSVEDGRIESIVENKNHYDCFITPGFVDAHVHIESSMLTPFEFSKLAIQKGTVAVVTDPHEIANVLGEEGIEYMIENTKRAFIKMFFTIPSCVPATPFDCSGGEITSEVVKRLLATGNFIGLSEVMNVPGVLNRDKEVYEKINPVRERGLAIDGHAPGLRGSDLKLYVDAGITTDHECTTFEEALEKIDCGMKVLIREGSAARDYEALKSLINCHPDDVMFCTDDSHPDELIGVGHIDKIVKRAIEDGFDLFDVLKIASLNPIKHYRLDVGVLKEGEKADFVVYDDLRNFTVLSVYINGEKRYDRTETNRINSSFMTQNTPVLNKFVRAEIRKSELEKQVSGEIICIHVEDGEIVTGKKRYSIDERTLNFESDIERDILKIVYINRYKNENPQVAYINGMNLKRGAFATSISHDSHNIIAIGCSDDEILKAVNAVICEKGGLAVADGDVVEVMALPIAGIMSDKSGVEVAEKWSRFNKKLEEMGCTLSSPFMTLSFMALIVIPELKIGERGLFEYSTFSFIS